MKKVRILFWLYAAIMLWLLFGQRMGTPPVGDYRQLLLENLNLRPFETLSRFWWVLEHSNQRGLMLHAFMNLGGNVVLFIPLGLFLPALWQKLDRFLPFFAYVAALIAAVELIQLFTLLGSCDVDDLILNLLGATLGFFLRRLWLLRKKQRPASK